MEYARYRGNAVFISAWALQVARSDERAFARALSSGTGSDTVAHALFYMPGHYSYKLIAFGAAGEIHKFLFKMKKYY